MITTSLTPGRFLDSHLRPRIPVVVRGAADTWPAHPPWPLDQLVDEFGSHRVALFDSLFAMKGLSTLRTYVESFGDAEPADDLAYLRWFDRQGPERFPWAEPVFEVLADRWAPPSWLPDHGENVFPSHGDAPNRASFPAKGLFICDAGARTRLHVDPWTSDACLCQVTGSKSLRLFDPADRVVLEQPDGSFLDLDRPDANKPSPPVRPVVDTVLHPGDVAYIPAGWPHTAIALEPSLSITWNFVHRLHADEFERYVADGGHEDPAVRYFAATLPVV